MEQSVNIDQLRQLLSTPRRSEPFDGGIRIVILQRGWVVVGRYSRQGGRAKIRNGHVIRRWGTTQGLPELARTGPLTNTVLEQSDEIDFHQLTEVANIKCREDSWSNHCPV